MTGHMDTWIIFYLLVSKTVRYKLDAGLYNNYQERGYFKGLIQEDLKEAVDFRKASALQSLSFSVLKESLPTTLKESMQLQLEATYRKNVQTLSNEIKRRVDYLKETEETGEIRGRRATKADQHQRRETNGCRRTSGRSSSGTPSNSLMVSPSEHHLISLFLRVIRSLLVDFCASVKKECL